MQEEFNFTCSDMPYFRQEIKEEIDNKVVKRTLESDLLQMRVQSLSQLENTTKKSARKKNMSKDDQQKCNQKKETRQQNFVPHHKGKLENNNCKILKFVNPSKKNLCFKVVRHHISALIGKVGFLLIFFFLLAKYKIWHPNIGACNYYNQTVSQLFEVMPIKLYIFLYP